MSHEILLSPATLVLCGGVAVPLNVCF